jgi:hypothetical protein
VLKVLKVLENQEQLKDGKENESIIEQRIDNGTDKVLDGSTNAASKSSALPNYKYTKENIEKFFASDDGQKEEHGLEDSICRPLIGDQIYKPFFHYCKICPKVEFISLKSLEHHIKFKDPERHKAKLLEKMQGGEHMDNDESKNGQDVAIRT